MLVGGSPIDWLPIIGIHLLFFSAIALVKALNTVDWNYLKKSLPWILPSKIIGVIGLISLPPTVMTLIVYSITSFYASQAVKQHHEKSLELYDQMLASGICREQARGVLPQNLYTEYYATANLNNILKFVGLRTHDGAQWEIQQLANSMLDIITEIWPVAVGSYRDINSHM